MNSKSAVVLLKAVALIILDVVCMLLVFNKWILVNLRVFPASLSVILFSLLLLNAVILCSSPLAKVFGSRSVAASAIMVTVGLFLFIMGFTWLTYIAINPTTYLIVTLLAIMIYIGIVAGLVLAGKNRQDNVQRQDYEKTQAFSVKMLVGEIAGALKSQVGLSRQDAAMLQQAANRAFERLEASTPFGRRPVPAVMEQENLISQRLVEVKSLLSGGSVDVERMAQLLGEIHDLTINRERLMIT